MLSQLFASVILLGAVLYIPGLLFFLALGLQRSRALVFAPALSVTGFSLLAIIYGKLGIFCTWANVTMPVLVLGILCFIAALVLPSNMHARINAQGGITHSLTSIVHKPGFASFLAYFAFGCLFADIFYLMPLPAGDAFINGWDNAHHMSVPRAFVESGIWSTLDVRSFADQPSTFYPSVNSLLPAIAISALGVPVAVGLNATNAVVIGLVFPLGMWLFMGNIFGWRDIRTFIGAACSMSVLAFPWGLLSQSAPVLYAQLMGSVFLPMSCAAVMDLLNPNKHHARFFAQYAIAIFFIAAALALSHPCAFFSALLFVICYVAYTINTRMQHKPATQRMLYIGAWVLLCVLAWTALFFAPFLQNVVQAGYPKRTNVLGGIALVLSLYTPKSGAQYVLGLIVIGGIAACLFDKKHRWLLLPYALTALLTVISFSFPPGTFKSFFTGFWYNHNIRLTATLAVFVMPLAAEGLAFIAELVLSKKEALRHMSKNIKPRPLPCAIAAAVLAVALLVPLPLPRNFPYPEMYKWFQIYNNPTGGYVFFMDDEKAFCHKVYDTIGPEPVILNITNDGSVYAYGVSGINTFDRSFYSQSDEDIVYLYNHLSEIATDQRAQKIAREHHISYLLELDTFGESGSTIYRDDEDKEYWSGIDCVDENTPGFEVVLSEGDMKLYRITALDENSN